MKSVDGEGGCGEERARTARERKGRGGAHDPAIRVFQT